MPSDMLIRAAFTFTLAVAEPYVGGLTAIAGLCLRSSRSVYYSGLTQR